MKKLLLTLIAATSAVPSFANANLIANVGWMPNLGYVGQSVFDLSKLTDTTSVFKKENIDPVFTAGLVGIKGVDSDKIQSNGIALRKDIILTTASALYNPYSNKLYKLSQLRLYNLLGDEKYELKDTDAQIYIPKDYQIGSVGGNNDIAIIKIKNANMMSFFGISPLVPIAGGANSIFKTASDFANPTTLRTLFSPTWGSNYEEGKLQPYAYEKFGCRGFKYKAGADYFPVSFTSNRVLSITTTTSGTPDVCKAFTAQSIDDKGILSNTRKTDLGAPYFITKKVNNETKFELLGLNSTDEGNGKIVTLGNISPTGTVENPAWTELKKAAGITGL